MRISSYTGIYPPATPPKRVTGNRPAVVDGLPSPPSNADSFLQNPNVQNPNRAEVPDSQLPVSAQQRAAKIKTIALTDSDSVRSRTSVIDPNQSFQTQRALAEYRDVDSREQRSEYTAVFGVDVYA